MILTRFLFISFLLRANFFSSEQDLREVEKVNNMNDALLDEMKVTIRQLYLVDQSVYITVLLNSDPFCFRVRV